MVMYFQRAREARPSGPYREALQGGFLTENAFLDSPEGREHKASSDLRIGRLIEDLGVNDIQFSGGLIYYINSPVGLTMHFTPDRIKIDFGDAPLVNLSDKPPFVIDFPPYNLAALTQALPEPVYRISHEVKAFMDAKSPKIDGIPDEAYKPTSLWFTGFPFIHIDVLTGETVSKPYPHSSGKTYSSKEIRTLYCREDSRLETKRVSGFFGINTRYEVAVVDPVKATIWVHADANGSCVEVGEDYINNPNVAKALDAVVEYLFQRDIVPPKSHSSRYAPTRGRGREGI